jgi:hypothetical protein
VLYLPTYLTSTVEGRFSALVRHQPPCCHCPRRSMLFTTQVITCLPSRSKQSMPLGCSTSSHKSAHASLVVLGLHFMSDHLHFALLPCIRDQPAPFLPCRTLHTSPSSLRKVIPSCRGGGGRIQASYVFVEEPARAYLAYLPPLALYSTARTIKAGAQIWPFPASTAKSARRCKLQTANHNPAKCYLHTRLQRAYLPTSALLALFT